MQSKQKRTWVGDNAHPNVRFKSMIGNKGKKLTHHEIIDRTAQ